MSLVGEDRARVPTSAEDRLTSFVGLMGIARTLTPFAFVLTIAACGDDPAPGCKIAAQTALGASALTATAQARMDRVEPAFVLIGHDEAGAQLRFAAMTEAGVLAAATTLPVPAHVAGPWYAVTAKTAPGDQLVAVYGVSDPTGAVALWITAVQAGGAPLAPRPLLDGDGVAVTLPAVPSAKGPQVAIGTSPSGKRAVLTWSAAPTGAPRLLLLGPDAASIKPTHTLEASRDFTCLAVTRGRQQFGISRVVAAGPEANDHPAWLQAELDDDGRVWEVLNYEVFTKEMGCPAIAPREKGYTFAWQNRNGTYFADVENTPGGLAYTSNIAKGAVRFGGPDQQPPLACAASAGADFSLTYDATAPFVERFSRFGIQQGGPLGLPGGHKVGPVSAWSTGSTTYLTFLDQVGQSGVRRLLRVECAAASPM
jgi:hypothetical protein